MNNIINIDEYGIDPASIVGFLNQYLYTDRHSNLLYNVNGKKGMVVGIEREFTPKFIPGGFSAHCINNIEQYRAPIKLVGKPREVELYRGNWGVWRVKPAFGGLIPPATCDKMEAKGVRIHRHADGWGYHYELTKSGKPQMEFCKFGKLEEDCAAFYDYNF
jgi:hypothetical protein